MAPSDQGQVLAIDSNLDASTKSPQSIVTVQPNSNPSNSNSKPNGINSNHDATATPFESPTVASEQLTMVQETVTSLQRRTVCEFGNANVSNFESMSLEIFLAYVTRVRLSSLPRRSSPWDRILKRAEFFAVQIAAYSKSVDPFIKDSEHALKTALGYCKLLVEMGSTQDQALEPAFNIFYQLGVLLGFFWRNKKLYGASGQVRSELGFAYAKLLNLVGDVAIFYRTKINNMSSSAVSVDFYAVLGRTVTEIEQTRTRIADLMWGHCLKKSRLENPIPIATIRNWLLPTDEVVRRLRSNRVASKPTRTEETCEWFQRYLLDFLRGEHRALAVNGAMGCGKSTIAGWVEERLQRPLGQKYYQTYSFTFEPDISSECSLQAMLKGFVAQLLDNDVGDLGLYESLAKAYTQVQQPEQGDTAVGKLYAALFIGLQALSKTGVNIILLVDGVDHVSGATSAKDIIKRLHETIKPLSRVQSIVFSRFSMDEAPGLDRLTIKAEHVQDDIRRTCRAGLKPNRFFSQMGPDVQEKYIDDLSHRAKCSFLWAFLSLTNIQSCENKTAFFQAIEKPIDSIEKILRNLLEGLDFQDEDIKHAVLWSMIAMRPMTLQEMTALLRVDMRTRSISERKIDISSLGHKLKIIMNVASGTFRFRHSSIRQAVSNYAESKKEFHPKSIQAELSQRLLLYVKLCVDDHSSEPSLDIMEWRAVSENFGAHCALEYCVRYWCQHFQYSSLNTGKAALALDEDFKSIFPSSCLVARYEWVCWGGQLTTDDTLQLHELALRVRQSVFGERHVCVLQSFIVIGIIQRDLHHHEEASLHWYHAVRIAKAVFTAHHSIVASLTSMFFAISEHVTITTRSQLASCKTEMLKLMIEISIHQHGRTSDVVILYHRQLINFYLAIKEHEHAADCSHRLYEIVVLRFGKSSKEAVEVSDELIVTLKKDTGGRRGNIGFRKSLFENCQDTLEIWDLRRIRVTLDLAREYEASGDIILAEETLIQLWLPITELCITKRTSEILIAKFDIAFGYVDFLQRLGRVEEARAILVCIWEEHQLDAHLSEMVALRFKALATLMKSLGLLTFAVNVFSAVWGFFKNQKKCEDKEAMEVTVLISETVEEIVSTTTMTMVETKTVKGVTKETETQLVEIFEMSIVNIRKYQAYSQVIRTCNALFSIYISLQQWFKAINILTRTLEVTWELFLRDESEGECDLPKEGVYTKHEEIILICVRYAECYQHQQNVELAEKYFLRIYHSCLRSLHFTDKSFQLTYAALIDFYEHYHQHNKAIAIYIELLERCRRDQGANHYLTIQILYKLARLCLKLGRREAYDYYLDIATVLNKGLTHCHHNALEASIILSEWYFETQQWEQCHEQCRLIWATVCHHQDDQKHLFNEEFIMTTSERYITVCRHHVKVEYTLLRKLVEEYRELSVRLFGAMTMVSICAMIQVATILELREESYYEAVAIYEEVMKKLSQLTTKTTTTTTTKTTTTTVTVTTVRQKLTKLYVAITKSSTKCPHETLQRAMALCEERFVELKMELGVWHSATLEVLTELIMLQRRLDTKESHAQCVHLLRIQFLDIITQSTIAAIDLFSAAINLAGIFITCGLHQTGFEMSQKLRRILIVRDLTLNDAFGFKCDHATGRSSYVFLVAFEEKLRGRKEICYTELMADILVETVLYEKLTQVLQVETEKTETILSVGAQLRRFLSPRKREHQLKNLDEKLYGIFWDNYGTGIPVKEHVKWTLYFTLITRIGESHSHQHSLIHHACMASDTSVKQLIQESRFETAYELATALFRFLKLQKAYHDTQHLGYGLKLLLHLASRRGLPKAADTKMAEQMLQLSKTVIQEVLDACKHHGIELASLELGDLNELIGLLGEQRNWIELEYLLTTMWSSRPTDETTWSETTTLTLARLLIHTRFLHPKTSYHLSAIALAEDVAYNLRRARGSLHPDTVAAYTLLSELYTKQARYRDSMGVHEEILRLTLCADDDDDGFEGSEDEGEGTRERMKGVVGVQVGLLKRAHLRLGEWDKSLKNYVDLFSRLKERFGKDVVLAGAGGEELKAWKVGGADDGVGMWQPPKEWRLMEKGQGVMVAKRDGRGGDLAVQDKEKEKKESKRWSRRISRMWGVFE